MKLKKWHGLGIIFTIILGTLLHFTYEWSGENPIVGIVSAVSESTWEHLKLLFWPQILFMVAEYFTYGKNYEDFFAVKMTAVLAGMLSIVVFFYTYTGVLGFNLLPLDILSFVIGVLVSYVVSYRLFLSPNRGDCGDSARGLVILALIGICFAIWTKNPPDLGLFWG